MECYDGIDNKSIRETVANRTNVLNKCSFFLPANSTKVNEPRLFVRHVFCKADDGGNSSRNYGYDYDYDYLYEITVANLSVRSTVCVQKKPVQQGSGERPTARHSQLDRDHNVLQLLHKTGCLIKWPVE